MIIEEVATIAAKEYDHYMDVNIFIKAMQKRFPDTYTTEWRLAWMAIDEYRARH